MAKTLEERLDAHPELRVQLLALLELAESDIKRADEVEERTVESVRSLGRQVIQDWAEQQEQTISKSVQDAVGSELELKGKKTLLDHDVQRDSHSGTERQIRRGRGVAPLQRVGTGDLSGSLAGSKTSTHRFWFGEILCPGRGADQGALRF